MELNLRPNIKPIQPKPVLKWAGGKQQLISELLSNMPSKYNRYIEPFFGGGALFFAVEPMDAIIADSNPDLINFYKTLASDVDSLIKAVKEHKNDEETFYKIRSINPSTLSKVEQAARILYLNRTCFNGLYRVNRKGEFNVPYGHYKNPTICDEQLLRATSNALKKATILLGDYKNVLQENAQPGDFIFLDPPYLPISKYSDFKRYTKEQFYEEDQIDLANEINRLHELGCHVIMTNSNHELIHELYKGDQFKTTVHKTRRNISRNPATRTGEDLLVKIEPKKTLFAIPSQIVLPEQVSVYPPTRYMGSKQNLLQGIWSVASEFKFETVTDLFSGSGVVSYMFKSQGKQVMSNDYMAFSACFAKALIENNSVKLTNKDIEILCSQPSVINTFVQDTFKDLYYSNEDNLFIDTVRSNLVRLNNTYKKSLAMAALVRACLKKRPRGIFTYVGHRYDDGRRDLSLSLQEQFIEAVQQMNNAIFDNGKNNKARHGDAMTFSKKTDLVYIDPPYYSPLSDNEYVRRYHFVEGLALDWQGVEIQEHTKTKKFKSYPTPFSSRKGAHDAFDILFRKHKESILIVSYSSNSQPTKDEMLSLMAKHKKHVDVISLDHKYSFGNQAHKVGDNNNEVKEYLFVGY